ncbi:MAG: DUF3016 domain-containing protein [Rhizobiales bacterium]|nr:DUF3016 domain-containing protein [Rhizobacter sp.]
MNFVHFRLSLNRAFAALLVGTTTTVFAAPGAPVETEKAEVSYRNPAGFTEMSHSFGQRTAWLDDLSGYVAKRAARTIPDGERLLVTITDVQRAGMVEPWRGIGWSELRVVRDTTPPRIELTFQLVAANGAVLKEGMRTLRDIDFLGRNGLRRDEPLSYEKNLIDDWMRNDFGSPQR